MAEACYSTKGPLGRRMTESALSGASPSPTHLWQAAAEALADEIARGVLPPGTALSPTAVARRFGISRTPARRALDRLREAGLIEGEAVAPVEGAPRAPRTPAPRQLTVPAEWERLYPDIELAIMSRTPLGGWRVNEAELARHHGVSRTVAREVVARLHQRGILRKDGSGRWVAPGLTPDYTDELYELRWVLEPVALEKAAPCLPPGYLAGLRDDLQTAMAEGALRDSSVLDRLEQQLHVDLLSHCANAALMQAMSLAQSLLVAHHVLYRWTLDLFGTEPFLAEHLEVVSRLEAGDVAGARDALVAHLRISRRRAMLRVEAVRDLIQPEPLPYLVRLEPA